MEGCEYQISDQSDWKLFDQIALTLQDKCGCKKLKELDGFDQRYWDFEFEGVSFTLHLEHYLGICIFTPEKSPENAEFIKKMYNKIHQP